MTTVAFGNTWPGAATTRASLMANTVGRRLSDRSAVAVRMMARARTKQAIDAETSILNICLDTLKRRTAGVSRLVKHPLW